MFRFVKTLLQRSAGEYLKDDCGQLAAAISYYALFSLFPLLIFVVAMAGLLIQDSGVKNDIVDEVLKNIPLSEGEGRSSVRDAVEGVGDAGGGALGVLGLSACCGPGAVCSGRLRKALNAVFDDYGVEAAVRAAEGDRPGVGAGGLGVLPGVDRGDGVSAGRAK